MAEEAKRPTAQEIAQFEAMQRRQLKEDKNYLEALRVQVETMELLNRRAIAAWEYENNEKVTGGMAILNKSTNGTTKQEDNAQ